MIGPPFDGFGPGAPAFFAGIARDNSREYFLANRDAYDADIRAPLERLLAEVEDAHPGAVKLFRPHRDVRFSADKRPYKETASGYVAPPGTMGFRYVQLGRDGLMAATGLWAPARDQLARLRAAIDTERTGSALERIVTAARKGGLIVGGDALATMPRGYRRDHSRADLLRLKAITASATLPPGPALHDRRALDHCLQTWTAAEPLIEWLDDHIGESEIAVAERFARR